MTKTEREQLAKSIAVVIREHVQKAFTPLRERIDALEQRKAVLDYRGTHTAGEPYEHGDIVTRAGTIWFCKRATSETPGESSAWQLIVKTR
jgi:hypothetical protein